MLAGLRGWIKRSRRHFDESFLMLSAVIADVVRGAAWYLFVLDPDWRSRLVRPLSCLAAAASLIVVLQLSAIVLLAAGWTVAGDLDSSANR